ncbi:MAG: hypothetical protein COS99_03145 [Candidatus Omnitrophica bacterium CG07_land_8_20_14_0_80_42_15]|uniref:Desulfoferrodoxin ferrous iron-binding domain-containing protein n=1 Tax=Candidatus Aquitaenariimonas noxiae TaxID=1974741 RepID=A0A2J0L5T3_9BACT|nr:MAG: hypothetical protein COS99_03145 [Candidatus Omnitrophica bacterium CG07_land_8_20_14_0_80_42_15]
MKKVFICLIFISIFLITSQSPAIAHPPTKITTSQDVAGKTLTILIDHQVLDPTKHFIWRVNLIKNGNVMNSVLSNHQASKKNHIVSFAFADIKPSDIIEVEAFCNINGKLKEKVETR